MIEDKAYVVKNSKGETLSYIAVVWGMEYFIKYGDTLVYALPVKEPELLRYIEEDAEQIQYESIPLEEKKAFISTSHVLLEILLGDEVV